MGWSKPETRLDIRDTINECAGLTKNDHSQHYQTYPEVDATSYNVVPPNLMSTLVYEAHEN